MSTKKIRLTDSQRRSLLPLLKELRQEGYTQLRISTFANVAIGAKGKDEPYDYEEARLVVQRMGIKTSDEYDQRYKVDPRLPSNPDHFYRKCWTGWENFVGNKLYTFLEALVLVRRMGIRTSVEYFELCKQDAMLPRSPQCVYRDTWEGFKHFLGPRLYTYEEAMTRVEAMHLSGSADYAEHFQEDPMLPRYPNVAYKDKGWRGWATFLGKNKVVHIS